MNGDDTSNGAGKRKVIDLRNLEHINLIVNGGTFLLLVAAIFWFANASNTWKNHQEENARHWQMTWTLPEMIQWCQMDSRQTKLPEEHTDPYEISKRFEKMKLQ